MFHELGGWFWWAATAGAATLGTLIWRASDDRRRLVSKIEDQGAKLAKHDDRLIALERAHVEMLVKLADIPTRSELVAQTAQFGDRFDRMIERFDDLSNRCFAFHQSK